MRYSAARFTRTGRYRTAFPVGGRSGWRLDYPGGYTRATGVAAAAGRYFFLNRGWRRSRRVFSHVRTRWEPPAGWVVRVWYADRRRRRTRPVRFLAPRTAPAVPAGWSRRYRRRYRLGRRRGGSPAGGARPPRGRYLRSLALEGRTRAAAAAAAGVWGAPRGVRWVWCRLPRPGRGNLETLVATVVYRLRGRFERRAAGVALPILRLTRRAGALGAEVRCRGRFTRRQRTDRQVHSWGVLRRGDPAGDVRDAFVTVPLRFGAVGVTLLVNYPVG